jgi:hypothetical protein
MGPSGLGLAFEVSWEASGSSIPTKKIGKKEKGKKAQFSNFSNLNHHQKGKKLLGGRVFLAYWTPLRLSSHEAQLPLLSSKRPSFTESFLFVRKGPEPSFDCGCHPNRAGCHPSHVRECHGENPLTGQQILMLTWARKTVLEKNLDVMEMNPGLNLGSCCYLPSGMHSTIEYNPALRAVALQAWGFGVVADAFAVVGHNRRLWIVIWLQVCLAQTNLFAFGASGFAAVELTIKAVTSKQEYTS